MGPVREEGRPESGMHTLFPDLESHRIDLTLIGGDTIMHQLLNESLMLSASFPSYDIYE